MTEKKELTIKTKEGIAEPMPLSDLQEYNKKLDNNTYELRRNNNLTKILILSVWAAMILGLAILIWLIYTNKVGYAVEVGRQLAKTCGGRL